MVAPIEQRFNAAVNVIRSLPKHGSYQPSNDMQLRFYAYFKQATLGPCTQQKPAFWNVVDKAKWDAYKSLGTMPAERAMELYVEELKKIIETMSYTDNVAEFMGSVDQLNDIDLSDLEAVAPDAIQKVRSRPNSPFASRESSPVRVADLAAAAASAAAESVGAGNNGYHSDEYTNGHSTTDHSDDEYIDTVEDDTILHEPIHHRYSRSTSRRMDSYRMDIDPSDHAEYAELHHQVHHHQQHQQQHQQQHAAGNTSNQPPIGAVATGTGSGTTTMHVVSANVEPALHQMLRCVEAMRVDLQQINNRISIVERSLGDVRQQQRLAPSAAADQREAAGGAHGGGKQATNPAANANACNGGLSALVLGGGRSAIATVPGWWPFRGITPTWFVLMAVVWPLVARRMARGLQQVANSSVSRRR